MGFSEILDQKDIELIQSEIDVLNTVKLELVQQVSAISENKLGEASQMKIGKAETKDEWSALYEQLNTFNAISIHKGKQPLPDPRSPYFAHIVLQEKDKVRDVLIGYGTLVGTKTVYPIVDWRKSPVAKLFFEVAQGENFVQQLPKRVAKGTVALRRVVNIRNSEIFSIMSPTFNYFIGEDKLWTKEAANRVDVLHGGQGKAIRSIDIRLARHKLSQPELLALLDKDQFEAMNIKSNQSLLVLGGAGSGKTTVALYRLAVLVADGLKKEAALVIVPNQGLVNLCRNILRSMHLHKVTVNTYDQWISTIGWKTFRGIPKTLCAVTPDEVIRIKRHVHFSKVLDLFIEEQYSYFKNKIIDIYPKFRIQLESVEWDVAKPLILWLDMSFECLVNRLPARSKNVLGNHFNAIRKEILNFSNSRISLLTNEGIISKISQFDSSISSYAVTKFLKHSREQFFERYSRVDVDKDSGRHLALDGVDESEYIDTTVYRTIDVEDFPILYYLLFRITGKAVVPGKETPDKYQHILLDEAQELSLLEVKTLGHLLSKDGSVTIAGDALQHTSAESSFDSWQEVLSWMGITNASTHRLTTNYRSTRQVAELATHVLGPLATFVPKSTKDGSAVVFDRFYGFGQSVAILTESLRKTLVNEPDASIAIICRTEKTAENIYSATSFLEDARLVLDGEFSFDPGIDITTVEQVKGLEFDYVVIPDADSHVYKDDPVCRRHLHVAVTRAVYQLWVFSTATPSVLIRNFNPAMNSRLEE